MACNPRQQLFNSDRPDYTNTRIFCSVEGYVTQVTASGLEPGDQIPLLIGNPQSEEWEPYVINGQPVVLTYDNPSFIVDEDECFMLDTSDVDDSEGVTVSTSVHDSLLATSVVACLVDDEGNLINQVEVVRYDNGEVPVIYELGTSKRIVNLDGLSLVVCGDTGGSEDFPGLTNEELRATPVNVFDEYMYQVVAGGLGLPSSTPWTGPPAQGNIIQILKALYNQNVQIIGLLTQIRDNTDPI